MIKSVDRLEQGLRLWEDHCFFYRKLVKLVQLRPGGVDLSSRSGLSPREVGQLNIGPFAHSEGFRKFLLNSVHERSSFDYEKYVGPSRVEELLGAKSYLPVVLWAWTQTSRRVYRVSRELQLLLGVTSLNDVTWGELHFPFASFAIALEDPLSDEVSGETYDLLLVSTINKKTEEDSWTDLDLTLFPAKLGSYTASTLLERKKVNTVWIEKQWRVMERWINSFPERFHDQGVLNINISLRRNEKTSILDKRWGYSCDDSNWDEGLHQGNLLTLWTKVSRIVAGLVLYFKSLPPNHNYIKEEHRGAAEQRERLRSPDKSCITDIAQVCTVSSIFELSREERTILESCRTGAGGYEVRAHFRCGYWRRPPGLGTDPTAQKTVWVRPTLVRRDRVPNGAVPGGAETDI